MDDLGSGMHPGIGPPGTVQAHRMSTDLRQGVFKGVLHGAAVLLALPAEKGIAGVLDAQGLDLDAVKAEATALFQAALGDLIEARAREGEKLAVLIRDRLVGVREQVAEVRRLMPEILQRQRTQLLERLESVKAELDPQRLEAELVLLAQKADVEEELDRLATHVTEVERQLGQKGPMGRRLDFLMQELNREANTLSSKSVVANTTRCAVELKVLIEQMREQIQNIE